jgi:SNF2 family DNA or RNA helicase
MEDPEGEKVLIFSQWTSLLDLLEIPIDNENFGYRRYDGSMSAKMREDAVDDFKNPRKNVRIMLISLKAGNAGLNLNMASQVIILDPFWNPYIEEQAIDRAHRIGQVRPVKVHRVLIPGTVEDRIIELQEKKRALISQALDEKQASALARLGVQELAYLFGVTTNPNQAVAGR